MCALKIKLCIHCVVEGWSNALHAEGIIFSTLFLLLFWDIVYSEVPNVFRGPYQVIKMTTSLVVTCSKNCDLVKKIVLFV